MAKNQSHTPGRDVRGGSGKRQDKIAPFRGGASRVEKASAKREAKSKGEGRFADQRGKRAGKPDGEKPKKRSSASKADLVIGRRAAAEALSAGVPSKSALVQAAAGERDAALEELAKQLEADGVEVERAAKGKLDALADGGNHQGVILRAKPFEYTELADIIRATGHGDALVVVLDHVTDQGNLGAIIRTAEVVGASGVVIPAARAAGVGVGAYKTSAGAVMHIPVAQVPNLSRALEDLKAADFWACAATEHAEQDVWHAHMSGRLALVMGSEGEGISQLVRKNCDFECRLPQRGRIESLNVAQATTVMCYEWLRRVSAKEAGGPQAGGSANA